MKKLLWGGVTMLIIGKIVGLERELRMIELKKENEELKSRLA